MSNVIPLALACSRFSGERPRRPVEKYISVNQVAELLLGITDHLGLLLELFGQMEYNKEPSLVSCQLSQVRTQIDETKQLLSQLCATRNAVPGSPKPAPDQD